MILNSTLKSSVIEYGIYKSNLKSGVIKCDLNVVLFNFKGSKNSLYLKLISNHLWWILMNK